jgi:hypothetical protein
MGKTKFGMPQCAINPVTEKPYSRHMWIIDDGKLKQDPKGRVYYHVVCSRPTCRLNSKNPIPY